MKTYYELRWERRGDVSYRFLDTLCQVKMCLRLVKEIEPIDCWYVIEWIENKETGEILGDDIIMEG